MGLDSHWWNERKKSSKPLDFDPPLSFEDDHDRQERRQGEAHFRSRSVHLHIELITGVSLRSHWLSNRVVRHMTRRMETYLVKPWPIPRDPERHADISLADWHRFVRCHLPDTARLFRAYAEAGYGLIGSW